MNMVSELFNQPFAQRVGWMLVHSIWQGAAMGLAFAVVRPALRRRSAQARYVAACGILLVLALVMLATLLRGPGTTGPESTKGLFFSGEPIPAGVTTEFSAKRVSAFAEWESLLSSRAATVLEQALPWVVGAWLLGVMIFCGRRLQGLWWVKRIKQLQTQAMDAEWLGRLDDLRLRLAVTRPVRLLISTLVEVPLVVGWLRPVILVPAACFSGLTPEQLEAIIAHELAHIRRHDYLVNAFQLAMETLMFYHPAVWWISGCIREEREHCCDDLVLRACADRVAYARALVKLEELRAEPQFAFAATGGSLLRRVRLLLGVVPPAEPASAKEFSGLALVGLGCVFVVTGFALMFGTPYYRAAARLRVERDLPGAVTGEYLGFPRTDYDPYFLQTEFEVLQSPLVLKQVMASLKLTESWGRRYGSGKPLATGEVLARLRARLSVRPIRNTSLVEIQVRDDDPAEAASIANAIADAYRTFRTDEKQRFSSAALEALGSRLSEQERKVREAQKKVDDLRTALHLAPPAGENAPSPLISAETLRRIEGLRLESQAELVREQALLNQLKTLSLAQLVQAIPTTGVQDALLVSLTEQLNVAEQKLVSLKKEYGPEHPELIKVASQVEDLNRKIKERAAGYLAGLEVKVAALTQSLVDINQCLEEAKRRDVEQAKQNRPYWEARRDLEDLERYRQVLFVKLASERTDLTLPRRASVELVEEAVAPSRPVSPNQPRAVALMASGLLLALMGSLLIRAGRPTAVVLKPA